ncbi:MAG: hypothetical protein ACM65K_19175 [Microcoleus sp.]
MIFHLRIPSSSAEADIVCVDAVSNRRGFQPPPISNSIAHPPKNAIAHPPKNAIAHPPKNAIAPFSQIRSP